MKLSIIIPCFRKELWEKLYNSLAESCSAEWELILVGPYQPDFVKYNMTWIEDWGHATRCQQRGLLAAKGEWLCFGWDDGIYYPGALDNALSMVKDYKDVVVGKFIEGEENRIYMSGDEYYYIKHHEAARSPYLKDEFMIYSTGIISKQLMLEVGGFDCRFETMALSVLDLSIRIQLLGCNMILKREPIMECTWQPGDTGDHGPVNTAMRYDTKLYRKIYKGPVFDGHIKVELDNWMQQPEKWDRRFS